MEHVAILRRSCISDKDNLLNQIVEGAKTIESRWYANRVAPWDKVSENEIVYFKESGKPLTARARVAKVLQFEKLSPEVVAHIFEKYGRQIAPSSTQTDLVKWQERNRSKRYCILIFLESVQAIKPINIDKNGFGSASAWLCVPDIKRITI